MLRAAAVALIALTAAACGGGSARRSLAPNFLLANQTWRLLRVEETLRPLVVGGPSGAAAALWERAVRFRGLACADAAATTCVIQTPEGRCQWVTAAGGETGSPLLALDVPRDLCRGGFRGGNSGATVVLIPYVYRR